MYFFVQEYVVILAVKCVLCRCMTYFSCAPLHLHSVLVFDKQAPLAISNAKISRKHGSGSLLAQKNSGYPTIQRISGANKHVLMLCAAVSRSD